MDFIVSIDDVLVDRLFFAMGRMNDLRERVPATKDEVIDALETFLFGHIVNHETTASAEVKRDSVSKELLTKRIPRIKETR